MSPRLRAPLLVLALVGAACLLGPLIAADPLAPDAGLRLAAPSWSHPLGTDALGRDLLARLLVGGRVSLAVAAAAALVSVLVGGLLGAWAGYLGGAADAALLRTTELLLALPKLPLLVLLTAVELPVSAFVKLVGLISAFGWMGAARLSRAAVLPLRSADFVRAARGFGASAPQIVRMHLLRHAAGPLLVAASLELGEFIVYESVLSFLGLGIPPPHPSWGTLLAEAFVHLDRAPMLVLAPGLLTFVTIAAFNRLGDELYPKSGSG